MLNQLMDFIISPVYAQSAEAAAKSQPNPLMSMLPFILIFFIFYFLMIRPQKKKMQKEQEMLKALNKGDEIFTKSGILGTLTGISDRVLTLEVADNVKIKVLREHVGGLSKQFLDNKEDKK